MLSHMSSNKEVLVDGLEAMESGYRVVAAYPIETLSRSEGHALLARLDKLSQELLLLQRRVNGRLIVTRATA
jgi:hypothetical protein